MGSAVDTSGVLRPLDAAASWNQLHALSRLGVGNAAVWQLGSEGPGFWPALDAWHGGHARPQIDGIELWGTVVTTSPSAIADARASGYPTLVGMQKLQGYHAAGRGKWQGTIFVRWPGLFGANEWPSLTRLRLD